MAEGKIPIAVAIATSLLLVSLAGGAAWFAMQRESPTTSEEIGEGEEELEPEPEPPVEVRCQSNERPIYADDGETVTACTPVVPPSNGKIGNGELLVTRGTVSYVSQSAAGDPVTQTSVSCSGDGGELRPFNETHLQVFANEIGNFSCTVTMSNAGGETEISIDGEVVDKSPTQLRYQPPINILTKGEPFTTTPTWQGGEPTHWNSTPPLPPGLRLRDDGVVIGAPSILTPATTYAITASNGGGSDSTDLTLAVNDRAPSSTSYSDNELVLTIREEMVDVIPSHEGGEVVSWEIDPALPSGLTFSSNSGRISGTPLELYERNIHLVYANNSGGLDFAIVYLTVNDIPVDGIDFDGNSEIDLVFGVDSYDTTPTTTGGSPTQWSIRPDLPLGLSLDNQTGRIWGSADTITPWTNHTVWANNSGGAFTTWLNVRIANMTPANISWDGGVEHVLAANQSVTISALNLGPTIETWEISPPLPEGLFFSTSNGSISGSPEGRDGVNLSRHAWTTHTIWANTSGGSLASIHSFAIHDLEADNDDLTRRAVGWVSYGSSWPSPILPIGEWAFSLGVDHNDRPIASASHIEKGRMVGYGHETMVARIGTNDNRANLSLNSLDWVCDGRGKTVGLESSFNDWRDTLLAEGYAVTTSATPSDLINLDCFVTEFWNGYSDNENQQIIDWLTEGGGLIMGGHSWFWSYSNSDVAHNYPGNKIAKTTGLFVSAISGSAAFVASEAGWGELYRLHGALPLIEDHVDGTQIMTNADATIAATTINLCVGNLPLDYTGVWSSLRAMSNTTGWIHINSSTPYSMDYDEVDDLILNIQEKLMLLLPADELDAHPSHVSFPGPVNPTAPRQTRTIEIDGNFSGLPSQFGYANARSAGRLSTGMYAPAGEVVNITLPQHVIGQGVGILIGAHTDSLWGKSSLDRHPRIYRSWAVTNTTSQVAASFGGPIYVTVAAGTTLGDFNVTIEGAVDMPYYVHGVTNISDWQTFLRNSPAPIAELQSSQFILTVPSWGIRNLDLPNVTMEFWDEALRMEHNLSGMTPWPRVERAVFDVQISAGWMHSGYPFMAHTASVDGVVNGSYMRQNGDWGMFHELGHNHQWMSSTLPGTTEATCNIYSVKLMTDLVGKDLRAGHSALNTASANTRVENYFSGGSQISSWSVWTALETYLQIQEEFGWGPITAAYQEYYYNLTTQPSGDSAEFNEYAKWISLKTGRNITSFLAAWGFPITETTQNAVDHLPVWTTDPLRGWVFEYDPETINEVTSNVTASKADLEWTIHDNGTNTTWRLCWGQSDGVMNEANWDACELLGTNLSAGGAGHPLGGLFSATDYYWRLTVTNGNGQWWDEKTHTFTTT
jgi:hypothetical protein